MSEDSCNSRTLVDKALDDDATWLRLCRYVADDVSNDFHLDTGADLQSVKESLVRHRVAAAAERQAHQARGFVVDIHYDPETRAGRMIVATPTGDRREEREALVEAVTAFRLVDASSTQQLGFAAIVAFLLPWLLEG